MIDVSEEFSLSVVIARCRRTPADALRWRFRFDASLRPDITIAVRMDSNNRVPFDYYLFPRIDLASKSFNLAEVNELQFDAYRLETLDFLYKLARRTNILEAA